MEELREIRRRISKRLLEARRREGTFSNELRRMERQAVAWARKEANGKRSNGHKGGASRTGSR
jgi:phosphopantetheinyl transferase (holo-ACP synthase)